MIAGNWHQRCPSAQSILALELDSPVVVSQGNDHDGPDLDLAVDDDSTVLDAMHAEHRCLRDIDNGGSVQRAKDATV